MSESIIRSATRAPPIATITVISASSGSVSGWRRRCGEADHACDPEAEDGRAEAPASGDPQQARDEDRGTDDHQVEDELVLLAEELHEDVLRARWLELDDEVADRDDERGRARHEPGDELADRDAERGRERACDERGRVERSMAGAAQDGGRDVDCAHRQRWKRLSMTL